ncbi:lytic transglycosylase domain-containing protein [Lysobacter auxotrophicus]|uniref:Lytic transglycosylase domain-containing protein n=1 Tax=Lysobacter auxotrophicus TaxID=2992573 RepID=A0ABN6ULM5_9GAMM|nr:lytic transglycosylase domain-containing protein [Lysobacter auxotrophicus]BDU17272.1 lytic transglycosylase domain-containing protein [Lysobacter auxotrophicus]
MTGAKRWRRRLGLCCLAALTALPVFAQEGPGAPQPPVAVEAAQEEAKAPADARTRNGLEIYRSFREGLAEPECDADATSARWRQHFAHVPRRLAAEDDDVLPLFGYVVDALRESDVPTEFALIPFVESGYRPGARSAAGPAGLWQMIAITARNHGVPIRKGYDGRLSPVDSTQAAVRYLKTLHGMFGGDWRLAVMAYNAGEYRVLGALKRSGQTMRDVQLDKLVGLPDITVAYVRKLHALSCLIEQADDRDEWMAALDRDVPRLQAVAVPNDVKRLDQWAARTGQSATQLQRWNPAYADGRIGIASGGSTARLLAVADDAQVRIADGSSKQEDTQIPADVASSVSTSETSPVASQSNAPASAARRHTVAKGESAWTIAQRYRITVGELMRRNGLALKAVLKPGQSLLIDALDGSSAALPAAAGSP